MLVILQNILLQLLLFIGVVYIIGFVISLLNRLFYMLVNHSRTACYATGFIGTPVHELSHAAMCVLFRHKIHEVKLFQIDDENGVLGYVRHSYNPKSIYQKIGNFFISVAPIVCGTAVLFLLVRWLMPQAFTTIKMCMSGFAYYATEGLSLQTPSLIVGTFSEMSSTLLSSVSVGFPFWVFLVLALCIALHQNLSGADIKGSLTGLPFLALLVVIVNVVLYFIPKVYASFTSAMNIAGAYLTCGLMLALICSCIPVLLALIFKGFGKLIFKVILRR